MRTRVLSFVRGADAGSARTADPALDLNAFAVAEDIELTLVLKDHGVELALAEAQFHPADVADVAVPWADPSTDIRALADSGVRVCAVAEDLAIRGLSDARLVDGVEVVEESGVNSLIAEHDVTLSTIS